MTTWDEAYERFDDMLDRAVSPIAVGFGSGSVELQPSRVLRKTDPAAYRTSFNDWANFMNIDTGKLEGEADRHR